jgi:hypothetical protein
MASCLWAETCKILSEFSCYWQLLPSHILHIPSALVHRHNLIESSSVQTHPGSLRCCQDEFVDPPDAAHGLWQRWIAITGTTKRHVALWHLSRPVSIQVDWVGFDLRANNLRPSGQKDHYVKFGNKNRDFSFSFSFLNCGEWLWDGRSFLLIKY